MLFTPPAAGRALSGCAHERLLVQPPLQAPWAGLRPWPSSLSSSGWGALLLRGDGSAEVGRAAWPRAGGPGGREPSVTSDDQHCAALPTPPSLVFGPREGRLVSSTNKLGEESVQRAVARLHPLASCSRSRESQCACTGKGLFQARKGIPGE